MPPTNEPVAGEGPPVGEGGGVTILIDGIADRDLARLASDVEAAVRTALSAQELVPTADAEVSVTFVDDAEIAQLNETWLGRRGATDVISFGLGEEPLVADVYVSVDTARRNAESYGVRLREELLRLVVHGVLHAAGYDHPEGETREDSEMFGLQERLLARLLEGRPES